MFNLKSKSVQRNVISRQSASEIIAITSVGEFVVSALASGTVLVFKICGEEFKFIKNIYLSDDQTSSSLISLHTCLIEDKLTLHRFVSTGLDNTAILIDVLSLDMTVSTSFHVLPGNKYMHQCTF